MSSLEVPASTGANSTRDPRDMPNVPLQEPQTTQLPPSSSTPIEMTSLSAGEMAQASQSQNVSSTPIRSNQSEQPAMNAISNTATTLLDPDKENRQEEFLPALNFDPQARDPLSTTPTNKPGRSMSPSASPLTREKTAPAIGPATDKPTPIPKESEVQGPVLSITLLLSNTGARHPYRLDGKYLKRRSVDVDGNNPINMSLYKLKELILRDWRDEWEAKPSSPDSIRLISMGKMLNDKQKLADIGFTNGLTPHIVHMTMKPQDIVDEEDAKSKNAAGKDREGNERSPGCRCVIQ